MTKGLGRDASRLIESALLQERVPTQIELGRVKRSLLRSTAIAVTTGAAAPLAAQTIAAKSPLIGFIVNGSFAGAVAIGVTLGGLTLGGGAWVTQRFDSAPTAQPPRLASPAIPGKGASSSEVRGGVELQSPVLSEPSGADAANAQSASGPRASARDLARRAPEAIRARPIAASPKRLLDSSQNTEARANGAEPSSDASTRPEFSHTSDPAPITVPSEARNESTKPRSLSGELAQLEQAQRAMNRGDATAALALLDQVKMSSQSSSLLDERLALEVLAACQTGQQARAERIGHMLLQRSPSSPLAARIRTSCAFTRSR